MKKSIFCCTTEIIIISLPSKILSSNVDNEMKVNVASIQGQITIHLLESIIRKCCCFKWILKEVWQCIGLKAQPSRFWSIAQSMALSNWCFSFSFSKNKAGLQRETFSKRGTILKDALESNFTNCQHHIMQALKLQYGIFVEFQTYNAF